VNSQYDSWRKSSYSDPDSDCIEVGRSPQGLIGVRDTKQNDTGPILSFAPDEWANFLEAVRATAPDQ